MNRKANVFRSAIIFSLVIIALIIVAIMSPTTIALMKGSSDQAGLTGLEELFFENFHVTLFLLGTAALFMYGISGGDQ